MVARDTLPSEIQTPPPGTVARMQLHTWCPGPSLEELPAIPLETLGQYLFLAIIIKHFLRAWIYQQIF